MAANDPVAAQPRRVSVGLPRRPWMWLVAALGVAIGLYFGIPICRHELAVRAFERIGGKAYTREFGSPSVLNLPFSSPFNDKFWVVNLDDTEATDATLDYLHWLPGPHTVSLKSTPVTDASLSHLSGLTGVQHLHLGNTQVSDSGLSHLRGLTNLSWLALNDTQVTDAGLSHLHGLPSLQWLWLNGTDVTEKGRAELKLALPHLRIDEK
jgi:hypothetical protein